MIRHRRRAEWRTSSRMFSGMNFRECWLDPSSSSPACRRSRKKWPIRSAGIDSRGRSGRGGIPARRTDTQAARIPAFPLLVMSIPPWARTVLKLCLLRRPPRHRPAGDGGGGESRPDGRPRRGPPPLRLQRGGRRDRSEDRRTGPQGVSGVPAACPAVLPPSDFKPGAPSRRRSKIISCLPASMEKNLLLEVRESRSPS